MGVRGWFSCATIVLARLVAFSFGRGQGSERTSGTTTQADLDALALNVSVGSDGSFAVSVDGAVWLRGGGPAIALPNRSQAGLKLLGLPTRGSGSDVLGKFSSTSLRYGLGGKELLAASIKVYEDQPWLAAFEQVWPEGLLGAMRS